MRSGFSIPAILHMSSHWSLGDLGFWYSIYHPFGAILFHWIAILFEPYRDTAPLEDGYWRIDLL